jgi:hypothetical protein
MRRIQGYKTAAISVLQSKRSFHVREVVDTTIADRDRGHDKDDMDVAEIKEFRDKYGSERFQKRARWIPAPKAVLGCSPILLISSTPIICSACSSTNSFLPPPERIPDRFCL